ncbi:MAG: outer membrane protein transport protein [Kofleriaceae bacterium]
MKAKGLAYLFVFSASGVASAGGLFLPGAGAVSTARAGAGVASADDAEAIVLNPAGIAKSTGTVITIGIAAIDYYMSFTRAGTYDPIKEEAVSYAGMHYPTVTNDASPPLGIGGYQPVPVIGIVSDLGNRIPGLHVGLGIYAPNAYPFRDMNKVNGKDYFTKTSTGYDFPAFGDPPPPSRYDIIEQEAAIILPSIDVAYSITKDLDVGIRGSFGFANLKSTVAVWGLQNVEEWNKLDGLFTLDAKDSFVATGGLGASYRIGPNIELGANYSLPINIDAKGHAYATNGPAVVIGTEPTVVLPPPDANARCEAGGKEGDLKGCVNVELPMNAQLGGRWKFLDPKGKFKGDIEVDLDWEHWGAKCDYTKDPTCQNPSDYRVVVDGIATIASTPDQGIALKDSLVQHGLQDTYAVRVGGSYVIDTNPGQALIVRGGVGYDTAAARDGWERADFDGAARKMLSVGASYKLPKWKFDAGFAVILEGTRYNNRGCNPSGNVGDTGCGPNGQTQPVDGYNGDTPSRTGPDPINPAVNPDGQSESPVNQGEYKSHYLMFMLGAQTWF